MAKLNQILAIEKDLKAKNERELTDVYKQLQKEDLFLGLTTSFRPYDDAAVKEPSTSKKIQVTGEEILGRVVEARTRLYDIVFTKDKTNTVSKATVKVGELVLLQDVPVSTLLYLEKQLVDLHTCVSKIPTLAPDKTWTFDTNQNACVTAPALSYRMKKIPVVLVKAAATVEHPAQVDVTHEDRAVGEITTVHSSGALTAERKQKILDRIAQLREAAKFAREEANGIQTVDVEAGKKIFDFLFGA